MSSLAMGVGGKTSIGSLLSSKPARCHPLSILSISTQSNTRKLTAGYPKWRQSWKLAIILGIYVRFRGCNIESRLGGGKICASQIWSFPQGSGVKIKRFETTTWPFLIHQILTVPSSSRFVDSSKPSQPMPQKRLVYPPFKKIHFGPWKLLVGRWSFPFLSFLGR